MTEDKDARITRLLGLLEQAEEVVDWFLNSPTEHVETYFYFQAEILKAKIEKEMEAMRSSESMRIAEKLIEELGK